MASAAYGSLPFAEAIAYLRAKVDLETDRWDDIEGQAHDRYFTVAGAAKADLLADLHEAVRKGIDDGTTLETFLADFDRAVAKHGWTGWTGSDTEDGRAWRTRTIYGTNLRTAYQAGRHAQHLEGAAERPYLQYHHADGVESPRPLHLQWDGLILRIDDPWVATHYTPNGWGCRCYWTSLAPRDLARMGKSGPDRTPDDGTYVHTDRDGIPHTLPRGIDYGWDHTPGATRDLVAEVRSKAARLPGRIGEDLLADIESPPPAPLRVFEPQATAKKAADYAVAADLADVADYTGVKAEVANEWNRSLFDHLQRFPALGQQQKFVGAAQAQYRRWQDVMVQQRLPSWRALNPGVSDADLDKAIRARLPKYKVKGKTWAHCWDNPHAGGIAVNKAWGAAPEKLRQSLTDNVANGWHPPGCDTIRSIVDHELGHQLDTLLGLETAPEIRALWSQGGNSVRNNVSRYATTNVQEMIAEGWAEYLNNPTPRPWARQIGETIERLYAARHPAP
jgi:hypothetical protein